MALPAWEELQGSPKDGITADSGPTAERLFLLLWAQKANFYSEMWASNREYPAFADCFLMGISTEPFSSELCPDAAAMSDPTSSLASYSGNGGKVLLARLQYGFDWGTSDWPSDITKPDYDDGTELALRVRSAGETMILPAREMRDEYYPGGNPGEPRPQHDSKMARMFVGFQEYQLEWRYVDDPPRDALDALQGHTNIAAFLGIPIGCLRFEGYELDAGFTLDPDDPFNWTVRICLKARRLLGDDNITWNHDFDNGEWRSTIFSDDKPRYPQVSFANMFIQDPGP